MDTDRRAREVLRAMHRVAQPMTGNDLVVETGFGQRHIYAALLILFNNGYIVKSLFGSGSDVEVHQWVLTDEGRRAAALLPPEAVDLSWTFLRWLGR